MIYELRTYRCHAGKLGALLTRFEGPILDIWRRIGIQQVGFWTARDADGADLLTYIVMWESDAQREATWQIFLADPDWKAAKAASEANGPLVESMKTVAMKPTVFSALQ